MRRLMNRIFTQRNFSGPTSTLARDTKHTDELVEAFLSQTLGDSMTEEIVSIEAIIEDAEAAAIRYHETGRPQPNKYPPLTAAHRMWNAKYDLFLLKHDKAVA